MDISTEKKYCSPSCPFFKCARRSLRVISRRHMCLLTGDVCEPKNCNFVICVANKLLPDGRCGREIKRITRPLRIEEKMDIDKSRIRGKLKEIRDELL